VASISLTSDTSHQLATGESVRLPAGNDRITTALGWFSIALGAAEILAPEGIGRLVGVETNPKLVKLLGAREIVTGIGVLTDRRPTNWLWARVVGDVLDLAVLGTARLRRERGARAKLVGTTTAVVGVTLLDVMAASATMKKLARPKTPRDQLVHFLSDMYSVEQQALAQLVTAPEIAGTPTLAEDFRQHHVETEQQADMVRRRLEAHGGAPSRFKDLVMKLGGKGFLLFAEAMPETPGRLVDHAYSYEAMEWAGYQMLYRFAERAGDRATMETAKTIGAQERAMMERLERGFDAAENASHTGKAQDEVTDHLRKHLTEVHAFESQGMQLLGKSEDIAGSRMLAAVYGHLLDETRKHAGLVEERLKSLDAGPSKLKDGALAMGGLNWAFFFKAQSDTPAKLAAFLYAVLHLEIGGYELLKRTAQRISDNETAQLCETIGTEKRAMAERLANTFDHAVDATLVSLCQ
jgi:ferritin-like metal-binding protein YciE